MRPASFKSKNEKVYYEHPSPAPGIEKHSLNRNTVGPVSNRRRVPIQSEREQPISYTTPLHVNPSISSSPIMSKSGFLTGDVPSIKVLPEKRIQYQEGELIEDTIEDTATGEIPSGRMGPKGFNCVNCNEIPVNGVCKSGYLKEGEVCKYDSEPLQSQTPPESPNLPPGQTPQAPVM